jgi:hypothetical protein
VAVLDGARHFPGCRLERDLEPADQQSTDRQ